MYISGIVVVVGRVGVDIVEVFRVEVARVGGGCRRREE